MEADLVSVIIPCYNQAKYLPDALNSLLFQTHIHWECIIVNDGSEDNTEMVALEWCHKDNRFKYFKTDNKGPSAARNTGLENCSGNFIQFLDGDDVIHPEKLKLQIDSLEGTPRHSISICDYFSSMENDLSQPYPGRYVSPYFKTGNYLNELIIGWESELSIPIHCFLFKNYFFKDMQIRFNEKLPNHVDWECWLNIFRLGPEVKFVYLKLATYRIQPNGICHNQELMKKGFLQAIEIQRNTFNKGSEEYKLFQKKANYLKFGIKSNKLLWIYLLTNYKYARRFAGKILRNLRLLR